MPKEKASNIEEFFKPARPVYSKLKAIVHALRTQGDKMQIFEALPLSYKLFIAAEDGSF